MTLCEKCRKPMIIRTSLIDFGTTKQFNRNIEFEFEACPYCLQVYVSAGDWTVKGSN